MSLQACARRYYEEGKGKVKTVLTIDIEYRDAPRQKTRRPAPRKPHTLDQSARFCLYRGPDRVAHDVEFRSGDGTTRDGTLRLLLTQTSSQTQFCDNSMRASSNEPPKHSSISLSIDYANFSVAQNASRCWRTAVHRHLAMLHQRDGNRTGTRGRPMWTRTALAANKRRRVLRKRKTSDPTYRQSRPIAGRACPPCSPGRAPGWSLKT